MNDEKNYNEKTNDFASDSFFSLNLQKNGKSMENSDFFYGSLSRRFNSAPSVFWTESLKAKEEIETEMKTEMEEKTETTKILSPINILYLNESKKEIDNEHDQGADLPSRPISVPIVKNGKEKKGILRFCDSLPPQHSFSVKISEKNGPMDNKNEYGEEDSPLNNFCKNVTPEDGSFYKITTTSPSFLNSLQEARDGKDKLPSATSSSADLSNPSNIPTEIVTLNHFLVDSSAELDSSEKFGLKSSDIEENLEEWKMLNLLEKVFRNFAPRSFSAPPFIRHK
ncbi:MAG: hypothetical protein LBB09_02135 [Rickettsiales bacterium]|jgi:hypothetical protein|nr:hypothetical protein [Rickettsiales bacterium]